MLLRVVLGRPNRLRSWKAIARPISSTLVRLECLRTIDRARIRLALDDEEVALRRSGILEQLEGFDLVPVDDAILRRAAEPFPTVIGSLDAIHLATALAIREERQALALATHDAELATAARSMGFRLLS